MATPSLAITSAGTTLSVGAAPATYDAPGFTAVSWTQVAEVTNIGSFGKKYNIVKHMPVDQRGVVKRRGSYDPGTLQIKVAKTSDAGQAFLRAANDSDTSIAMRLTLPSGKNEYFTGVMVAFTIDVASVDTILGATIDFELDNTPLEV